MVGQANGREPAAAALGAARVTDERLDLWYPPRSPARVGFARAVRRLLGHRHATAGWTGLWGDPSRPDPGRCLTQTHPPAAVDGTGPGGHRRPARPDRPSDRQPT